MADARDTILFLGDCSPYGLSVARAILDSCPFPVAATSANISDNDPAVDADELDPELTAAAALVVDGGRCPGERPSTVVDATATPPRILREGPITAAQIVAALAH